MADVKFTISSRFHEEKGGRQNAVAAWKTAREYANRECFARHPKEPVTVTVGGVSVTGHSRVNLGHKIDQKIRAAKS